MQLLIIKEQNFIINAIYESLGLVSSVSVEIIANWFNKRGFNFTHTHSLFFSSVF